MRFAISDGSNGYNEELQLDFDETEDTIEVTIPTATSGTIDFNGLTLKQFSYDVVEIDSTDGDDAYTIVAADLGGIVTNQGDDDGLDLTLPEASTWYQAGNQVMCITIVDVEGQTINVNPADGTDQILSYTDAAGDSLDSAGSVGDLIKLCAVGDNEIAVFGSIGVWADAN